MISGRGNHYTTAPLWDQLTTRNDIVDDIVDVSSLTMAFNVAKISSSARSLTILLTKSLRVAGPLIGEEIDDSVDLTPGDMFHHIPVYWGRYLQFL